MKSSEPTLLQTVFLALCLRLGLSLSEDGTYYPGSGSGLLGSPVYRPAGSSGGRSYQTFYTGPGLYSSSSSSTLGGDYGVGYGGGYSGGYGGDYGVGYSGGYDPYRRHGSTGYNSGFWPVREHRYRRSAPGRQTRSISGARARRDADDDQQLRFEIARLLQSVAINEAAKDLPFYPDSPQNGDHGGVPVVPRPPGFIPGRPNPYPANWPYGTNGGSGSYGPGNGGSGSYVPGNIVQSGSGDRERSSSIGGSRK